VDGRLAGTARRVSVEGDARHPGELVASKNQGPPVPLFARHARVNKDVLQLAGAATAHRPQPQTGSPVSNPQLRSSAKVRGAWIVAPRADRNLETRTRLAALVTDDLHVASHDTET
jgi:hypothetical protein